VDLPDYDDDSGELSTVLCCQGGSPERDVSVCVCVCVCVRARARVRVCVCARALVRGGLHLIWHKHYGQTYVWVGKKVSWHTAAIHTLCVGCCYTIPTRVRISHHMNLSCVRVSCQVYVRAVRECRSRNDARHTQRQSQTPARCRRISWSRLHRASPQQTPSRVARLHDI
jgi:hypothetical protein